MGFVTQPSASPHNCRGVEQWQLVGLITRRSQVRILSPLPTNKEARHCNGDAPLCLFCFHFGAAPQIYFVVLFGGATAKQHHKRSSGEVWTIRVCAH